MVGAQAVEALEVSAAAEILAGAAQAEVGEVAQFEFSASLILGASVVKFL